MVFRLRPLCNWSASAEFAGVNATIQSDLRCAAFFGRFSRPQLSLRRFIVLAMLIINLWLALPMAASWAAAEADSTASGEPANEATENTRPLPGGSADISSETLNRFVLAYRQVLNLVEERADELRRAETETESLRIQQQLEQEAIAKIQEEGLSWQEYVQLLSLANSDPELGERIVTQLQEL